MHTARLTLRRFTPEDVDNLVALDGDPEVMRYLNGGVPTPPDVIAREILPGFIAASALGSGYGVWALVARDGGSFLGWASLRPGRERPGEATLGYRLRRDAWGQGYATEAARALLEVAFDGLGVLCVTATTYQDNHASRQVMERLGMTYARSFRYDPDAIPAGSATYVEAGAVWDGDDVEYALTRDEWRRQMADSG